MRQKKWWINIERLSIINSVLLDLYDRSGREDIRELFLNELRLIVPYTQASFWLHCENLDGIIPDPVTIDMSKRFLDRYEFFADKDYLSWLYNHSSSLVYCGSKLLENSVWHATEFYKGYLLPEKIAFSCGIVLIRNSRLFGTVNLFRTDIFNDFSEEELSSLELFMPHVENIVYKRHFDKYAKASPEKSFKKIMSSAIGLFSVRYNLSNRETEIIEWFCGGFSTCEIAGHLGISLSTAKKHMNHIFAKANISNKNQLFAMILDCVKASLYS